MQLVHAKLMRTSKVKINDPISGGVHYINAGFTRQTTQKSVVRRSQQYNLAFCPAERVDQQLEYICRMGKVSELSFEGLRVALCVDWGADVRHSNTLRAGGTRLRRLLGFMSLSCDAIHSMYVFPLSFSFLVI
jgi:hypothetical protein